MSKQILNNWQEQYGKFNQKLVNTDGPAQKQPAQNKFNFKKPTIAKSQPATTNKLSLQKKSKLQGSLNTWLQPCKETQPCVEDSSKSVVKKPQAAISPMMSPTNKFQKKDDSEVISPPPLPQLSSFPDFDDDDVDDFIDDSLFLPTSTGKGSNSNFSTSLKTEPEPSVPCVEFQDAMSVDTLTFPTNTRGSPSMVTSTPVINRKEEKLQNIQALTDDPALSPLVNEMSEDDLKVKLDSLNKLQCKIADNVCDLVDKSIIYELLEDSDAKKLKQFLGLWKRIKAKSKQVTVKLERKSNNGSVDLLRKSTNSPQSMCTRTLPATTATTVPPHNSSPLPLHDSSNCQSFSSPGVHQLSTKLNKISSVNSFEPWNNSAPSSSVKNEPWTNSAPSSSLKNEPWNNSAPSSSVKNEPWNNSNNSMESLQRKGSTSQYFGASTCNSSSTNKTDPNTKSLLKSKASTNTANGIIQGVSESEAASFSRQDFPHSKEMLKVFRQTFALHKFRTNQLEAVNVALLGKDCFILMPTGGGKSLCYQLPGSICKGLTLVVSPLRSLIQDQVQKLCLRDIPATHLSSDVDAEEVEIIYRELSRRDPQLKLLYVTPEKLSSSAKLMTTLQNLYSRGLLARFVIDEAHCVSQWGHDFRPDYKRLRRLRENFPSVPIMALTATATPRVRTDIVTQLGIRKPIWFIQSFNRSNLKYSVYPKKPSRVTQECIDIIKGRYAGESGIIYCLSRKECDTVAAELSSNGISAKPYHAGLESASRTYTQQAWVRDEYKVVCATIAFGMGIDKPDVRFVIHHSLPKSIEGYYQESGRAGRDGNNAGCILFYSYQDMTRMRKLIERECDNYEAKKVHLDNLYRMVQYCENDTDCRRAQLLQYLGEDNFDKSLCAQRQETACDNCLDKGIVVEKDMTELAKLIVNCIDGLTSSHQKKWASDRYTLNYIVDILRGAQTAKILSCGHNRLPLYGKGTELGHHNCERLMRKLVLNGILREEVQSTVQEQSALYVHIGPKASQLRFGNMKVELKIKPGRGKRKCTATKCDIVTSNARQQLMKELQETCRQLGRENAINHAHIFASGETLQEFVNQMPRTEEEMLQITGVTEQSMRRFGERFLLVINKYASLDSNTVSRVSEAQSKQSRRSTKRSRTDTGGKAKRRKSSVTTEDRNGGTNSNRFNAAGKKPGFLSVPKPSRSFLQTTSMQYLG